MGLLRREKREIFKNKKVGLALGSGAARGLSHIGVLRELEKNNIPIDIVSGTSMGAVIGALYAAGNSPEEMEKIADKVKWSRLADLAIPRKGLIKGNEISSYIRENMKGISDFKNLNKRLVVSAVDIFNNKEVLFKEGDIINAVRASIYIPGIFIPVENNNRILTDGAIINPLPIEALKDAGADIIIGINVNPLSEEETTIYEKSYPKTESKEKSKKIPNIMNTLLKTSVAIEKEKTRQILKNNKADLIMTAEVGDISHASFYSQKELISRGEQVARNNIKKIKSIQKTKLRDKIFGNK